MMLHDGANVCAAHIAGPGLSGGLVRLTQLRLHTTIEEGLQGRERVRA